MRATTTRPATHYLLFLLNTTTIIAVRVAIFIHIAVPIVIIRIHIAIVIRIRIQAGRREDENKTKLNKSLTLNRITQLPVLYYQVLYKELLFFIPKLFCQSFKIHFSTLTCKL